MASTSSHPGQTPLELFGTDALIDEEDRAIRDTVRRHVEDKLKPHIAEWYESGSVPARELTKELGGLGVLGMHSRATAVRAPAPRRTAWPAWSSRPATPGCARWSACRDRWRCTRSGST